jgi:hypothetical protein
MKDPVQFWRNRISDIWHEEASIWMPAPSYTFETDDQYTAFCASKDWLQDTAEALDAHMSLDFSEDALKAYIEFWGVLQALFIQQDAIKELTYSLFGTRKLNPEPTSDTAWHRLRELRNLSVGHPTARGDGKNRQTDPPKERCVSGREQKTYQNITLSIYRNGSTDHATIDLKAIILEYRSETETYMRQCYCRLLHQLQR